MFVTVVTPIVIAGYIALGAASALGGWLFNSLVHLHKRKKAIEAGIEKLEAK